MEQEQEILQQRLSNVINAPTISSFLSSDHSHISIFDTLLGCHITGVDSEIRTEYENGKVVRFPVLTFCLDGLDRLLEKHELARQMLQEKINAEGGRPGVYGKLAQSLPIARTGFLCAGQEDGDELVALKEKMKVDNAQDLAKLKDQLEAEYGEKKAQLNALNAREPANLEQTQDIEAATDNFTKFKEQVDAQAAAELKKYKEDAYNEAMKAATAVMNAEFERSDKIRENEAAKELAKLKEDLETKVVKELANLKAELRNNAAGEIKRLRGGTIAKNNNALEHQQAQHNKNYKNRMKANTENFKEFMDKWSVNVKLEDNSCANLTYSAAAKLLVRNPIVFNQYKELLVKALKKYKQELKEQYQNHLNDIELECRRWLKANAGSGVRVEVMDGLQNTLFQARGYDHPIVKGGKEKIENPGAQMSQEDLKQTNQAIIVEFEAYNQKDVSERGLRLQSVVFQKENLQRAVEENENSAIHKMMAIIDGYSDSLVAERTFLGTPLKEIQPKTQQVNNPRKFSNGVGQPGMQPNLGELAVSGPAVRGAGKEHVPMPTNSGGRGGMRGNGEDVEQVLHPKNVNSSLGGTHSMRLQPAAGWYAANKNRPTSIMPGNPINNNVHSGDVYARAEKGKYSSPELIITAIRPRESRATIPDVPSLAKSEGAQMKPTDIPRSNQTINIEAEKPTRQQPFRQSAPIFACESHRLLAEANDRSTIADMESHIETLLQEQPLASRTSRTKQKMFDAMFYGKTVTEIYEILGKRKRSANNEGIEDRPLHKKFDQHGFTEQ